MKYRVWTKYWTENSCGEQSEGPWFSRGVFAVKEDAEFEARGLREWREDGGTFAKVEEEE